MKMVEWKEEERGGDELDIRDAVCNMLVPRFTPAKEGKEWGFGCYYRVFFPPKLRELE